MAGSESYVTGLVGYKLVAAAAKSGIPGAKTVYENLKKRLEGQENTSGSSVPIVPESN